MAIDFQSIHLKSFYSTTGHRILKEVINPVLKHSSSYDRLTGYFTVQSLVSVAAGLESLYRSNGKMRLVIGIHDVDFDLVAAKALGSLFTREIVEEYKMRFLDEVGKLSELTEISAIAGIAWMIRLGLLEVRIAAPKNTSGIFHQKRMIFRDKNNNVIAGTGSLNETVGGLYNVEEMQFSFSWKSDEDMTRELVDSFNEIWEGNAEDVEVIELHEDFASAILQQIDHETNPFEIQAKSNQDSSQLRKLVDLIRLSPTYAPFNLSQATLYPHQERVFSEALSRWPIRVMLADEVGLGKTLEAGIIISYLLRMQMAEQVTILCPAGLMRQWQEDSGRNDLISMNKTRISLDSKLAAKVKLKLVSAQWARLNENRFQQMLPDLLLVDEAHAARVNIDAYGTKTTRLWKLLDSIKSEVPHFILLTATPMQVHASEYHGLLKLLGLPKQWQKFTSYEESLKAIAGESKVLALDESKTIAELLISAFQEFVWLPSLLTHEESLLIMELRQAHETSKSASAIRVQQKLDSYLSILTKVHPGHFLTCRNTKKGLERFGYRFPTRLFESPKIVMNGFLERYQVAVESYLSDAYGKTEESLKPAGKFPIGFAKSGYYQRLVSSLYASRSSLQKRKEKLDLILDALDSSNSDLINQLTVNFDIEDEDVDKDEFSFLAIQSPYGSELSGVVENVKKAVHLETSYINELISILARMGENIESHDPKFAVAMEILEERALNDSVLVFSRFTDTLDGFLRLFEGSDLSRKIPGFALYTGGKAWIQSDLGRFEATKSDVTDALNAKIISIVFCSDAASEGLNLQAAKVLINLDVPWNPARLEQRIGRIARLGQKASEVVIYNLWYPESIEAKMYTRLLSRQSEYELAVGEAAEIFSDSIRREVAAKFDGNATRTINNFAELQKVREDFQRIALERIWKRSGDLPPASTYMREDILKAISQIDSNSESSKYSHTLTALPGTSDSFTLLHRCLEEYAEFGTIPQTDGEFELCALVNHDVMYALGVINSNNLISILNVFALGKVLQAILGMSALKSQDFFIKNVERSNLNLKLQQFMRENAHIPNHQFAQVPFQGFVSPTLGFTFDNIEIKRICKLEVDLSK
jgi:superfamily II DNA or RNA helicase